MSIDASAAQHGGTMHGMLLRKGTPVGALDCLIAGAAHVRNEPVLTLNTKDFARLGVRLVPC